MNDIHVSEDMMIDVALGRLGPEQAASLRHLNSCQSCRSAYDDLTHAVDSILPGAPTVAPPAGFDARVLDRLELRAPERHRSFRIPLLVAAAVIAGLGGGAVGAAAWFDQETTTASVRGAALLTGSGSTVGTVEPSEAGGQRVVVLQVTKGRPGAHYTCRVRLEDGSVRETGDWWMPASGQATWIVPGSSTTLNSIELVADDGRVWASARLG